MSRLRSFTLFELLLAIILLSALVFVLLPAARRVMDSSAAASDRSQRLSRLALLSDMIDRSMLTLLAVDAEGKPGFELTRSAIKLTSCGVSLAQKSEYPDIQTLEIRHSSGAVSVREAGGAWQQVLEGVSRVEFLLHESGSWQGSVSGESAIPVALSVSVWFGDDASEDEELAAPEPGVLASVVEDEIDPDWRRVFAVFDPAGVQLNGAAQ
ncbi:MAG: hypothetical protein ED559_06925 [Phycisphaera sp.]|nr:MAG: hypothetical protein ED559_06925 [Phycisphaera sp.]